MMSLQTVARNRKPVKIDFHAGYTGAVFPIFIDDFAAHGVTLTPAADEDFDTRAQTILGGRAAAVLEVKPLLAIVGNRNPRTIVAYTVAWTVTRRNESSETTHTQFKFPDAVAGTGNGLALLQGRELKPGDQRLVGMGFEVWPVEYVDSYRDFGCRAKAQLGEVKSLRIALDAVIFDDGWMLGPDESRLAEHFIAYVRAKQLRYRDLVVGLETGRLGDDVFAPLRQALAAPHEPNPRDPLGIYDRQSAADVLDLHDRVVLEVFRRALRREPFSIRRA
jgi:hypothetical protein